MPFLSPLRRIRTISFARIVAVSITTSYMTSPDLAKNGSWPRQAKAKSIIRAAMPVLIAARRSTTTKHIAGISFRHYHPRAIWANAVAGPINKVYWCRLYAGADTR
jgi:hypothetical protein